MRRSPGSSSPWRSRRNATPTSPSCSRRNGGATPGSSPSWSSDAAERGELQSDVDRAGLADLLGSVLTGLARTAATAGDPQRYTAAVAVLERFFDGSLVTAR